MKEEVHYSYSPLIDRLNLNESDDDETTNNIRNKTEHNTNAYLPPNFSQEAPTQTQVDDEYEDEEYTQATPIHANMSKVWGHHKIYQQLCSFSWNFFTWRYQRLILLVFLLLLLVGFYLMPVFLQYTDSTFHPVPGSLSAEAVAVFRNSYGNSNETLGLMEDDPMNPGVILVLDAMSNQSFTHDSYMGNQTRTFALQMQQYLLHHIDTVTMKLNPTVDINTIQIAVTSYFSLQEQGMNFAANKFITSSGQTTVMFVSFSIPAPINQIYRMKRAYIDSILDCIQDYGSLFGPDQVNIGYTGLRYFDRDIAQGVQQDLHKMDLFVIPLALIVLYLVLGGGTLAILVPILTLLASMSLWAVIMALVVQHVQITQITPTVMMSLTLGLGTDYSLFLLSRLFSELSNPPSDFVESEFKYIAIGTIIQHTGATILASGTTLALTFLGMMIIPLPAIQSIAIGATVAIASTIFCNLTMVPALMHTPFLSYNQEKKSFACSGSFLNPIISSWRIYIQNRRTRNMFISDHELALASDHDYTDEYVAFRDLINIDESTMQLMDPDISPPSPNASIFLDDSILTDNDETKYNKNENISVSVTKEEDEFSLPQSFLWTRISSFVLNPSYSPCILFGISLLLLPIAIQCKKLKLSLSMNLLVPQTSPSFETFNHLGDVFGYGTLSPYRIIFHSVNQTHRVDSDDGFDMMHQVLHELSTLTSTQKISFLGIAWFENEMIPHPIYKLASLCTLFFDGLCPIESLRSLSQLSSRATNESGDTTIVTCILPFSSFSDEGVSWLENTRALIHNWDTLGRLGNYKVFLEGEAAIEYDALQAVSASFSLMITITSTIVFLILYLFSRSIMVPVRSICSISLTLFVVFGSLVSVYQNGILDWLQISSLRGTGEISWLAPILAFSVTIGLGLDYDLFVTSRILEFRLLGLSHDSSIVAGLCNTGKIVTAAGIIMAIAFGGLLFSTSPVLNQWSFLLTSAVLVDTFLVRTILVPILLQFLGDFAWWPRRLPSPRFKVSIDGRTL